MFRFLSALLDIILPRKERVMRSERYSIEDLLVSPTEHVVDESSITTLMSYRTQAVDDLVRALKYDRAHHAAALLAEALAEYLREEITSLRQFSPRPIVLVAIPLHRTRLKERGFNQVEAVLAQLPREFQDGTVSSVRTPLARTRATAQQTRLSRAERQKNVANAFTLTDQTIIDDAHVILIDDVTTTGATLREASRPLCEARIPYSLLALAHA